MRTTPRLAATLLTLAVLTAPAFAVDTGTLQVPMHCFGGEPFWSLAISKSGGAKYKDDLVEETWKLKSVYNAMGRPNTWRVTFDGNRRIFVFDEGQQACSDSDGDEPMPFGVLIDHADGGFLRGCCKPDQ